METFEDFMLAEYNKATDPKEKEKIKRVLLGYVDTALEELEDEGEAEF